MRMRIPLLLAMFVVAALAAVPASAQATSESSCTVSSGGASVTYDCGFNVKDYALGSPVTLSISYSCSGAGTCGPVMSFGLRDSGFTPAGVSGHLTGGHRTASGLDLTFVFDSLKETGGSCTGNAHFLMNMLMDDGSGGLAVTALPFDVHLNGVKTENANGKK
jgi:hypothetical protein